MIANWLHDTSVPRILEGAIINSIKNVVGALAVELSNLKGWYNAISSPTRLSKLIILVYSLIPEYIYNQLGYIRMQAGIHLVYEKRTTTLQGL